MSDTGTTTPTNGTATPPASEASSGPDWSKFTESLEALNAGNGQLGGKLDTLIDTVKVATTPRESPAPPVKLDELSRDEFAAHLIGTITRQLQEEIKKAVEPVVGAVNGLQQSTASREINSQIAELKSKNKDFDSWKSEMIALSKENPTLSVNRLYTIARAENPDKAKELDAKFNPPPPAPERPRGFGGLTVFGRSAGLTEGEKPASKSEAALEAYREVQARHSGVLRALEEM